MYVCVYVCTCSVACFCFIYFQLYAIVFVPKNHLDQLLGGGSGMANYVWNIGPGKGIVFKLVSERLVTH